MTLIQLKESSLWQIVHKLHRVCEVVLCVVDLLHSILVLMSVEELRYLKAEAFPCFPLYIKLNHSIANLNYIEFMLKQFERSLDQD